MLVVHGGGWASLATIGRQKSVGNGKRRLKALL